MPARPPEPARRHRPAALPEPPWRANARGRGQVRPPLSRAAIVETALRVLDRDGLAGLSMHRVAKELGTGAASLYWYVRNKDELLQLLSERVYDEVVLPRPEPARWQAQVRDVAQQLREAAHRHPDSARISLGRLPSGPTLARFSEWLFELLAPLGVPDRQIAYFADLLNLYVGAFAFEESLGLASPTGEDLPFEQIVAMLRGYLLSLPAERFPHIQRAIDDLFAGGHAERFAFGLDLLLRGLSTYTRPARRRH